MGPEELLQRLPNNLEGDPTGPYGLVSQPSGSARGSSAGGTPSPPNEIVNCDGQDHDLDHDDENEDSDACNRHNGAKCSRPRKPHLQGRFSGRLETKQDEKRLAEECRLLGPMLGGTGKRGEKSRLTLAKIVRGIASGDVRKYCLSRERKIQELSAHLEQARSKEGLFGGTDRAVQGSGFKTEEGRDVVSSFANTGPVQHGVILAPAIPVTQAKQIGTAAIDLGPSQMVSMAMSAPVTAAQASEAHVLAHGAVQLKAQAQNFQAHAEQLAEQSKQANTEPQALQVAVQAQSFQAKAQSLEKAAEAQNLQAQAVVHAQAQAQAQAQAHHLVAQANDHAHAYAHAAAKADHLKKVTSIGAAEIYQAHEAVAAAQHLEHEAHNHAQAQTELTVQAHSLAAKAQAHANAQAQAQAQAQVAAVEAHQLDATAQQLQAEAQAVHNAPPQSQDKGPLTHLDHILSPRESSQGLSGKSGASDPSASHPTFAALDISARSLEEKLGPIISLQGGNPAPH